MLAGLVISLSGAIRMRGLVVVTVGLALVAGCDQGPPTARIRGKVRYKDGAVPKGDLAIVKFDPVQETTAQVRKSATGSIDPVDGSFEMNTRRSGDGVHFGDYTVTFNIAKGDGSPLVAPKFARPRETPFRITVDGDRSDLEYEIEPAAPGARPISGGLGPG